MTLKTATAALALSFFSTILMQGQALAFCGVIQEQATARTAERAISRADRAIRKQVRSLKRQHGRKLQLDEVQKACVGGGVAIDADGNQITGNPSCTVTQSFCVNP
jgi:hypothetical protein